MERGQREESRRGGIRNEVGLTSCATAAGAAEENGADTLRLRSGSSPA